VGRTDAQCVDKSRNPQIRTEGSQLAREQRHTKASRITAAARYISRGSAYRTAPETKTLQEVCDETSKTPSRAQKSGE
jgi:hypothetical protein